MKNIAIFLLVGLSLFSSGYGIDLNELGLDIKQCLSSLEKSDKFLTSLAETFCKDKHGESELEKVTESVKTTLTFLDKNECLPEDLLGLNIETLAADTLDELNTLLQSIVDEQIVILKPALDAVCKLLNPVLTSKCVHELVQMAGKTLKEVLTLKKCQPEDSKNIDLKTKKLLDKLQCGIAEVLHDVKLLPEETVNSVNKIVSSVANNILDNELLDDTLNGIICTVKNVLGAVKL